MTLAQTLEQRQTLKADAIAALRQELLSPVPAKRHPIDLSTAAGANPVYARARDGATHMPRTLLRGA